MTKSNLIQNLESYTPFDDQERGHVQKTLAFLNESTNCFDRSNLAGHVTGSCFLISPDGGKVLLMHHTVSDAWFKMGGHCDGSEDVLQVALREGIEESGISEILSISPDIFDVDIHEIKDRPDKNEPAHLHYDICYLFRAGHEVFEQNSESLALKWLGPEEALAHQDKDHYKRMIRKWRDLKK